MDINKAFLVIATSVVSLAAGGGTIGYFLGRLTPFYYRAVFRGGDSPDFDPVQVGVGLGLAQGAVAGLIIGVVVILTVSLSGLRRPDRGPINPRDVGKTVGKGCLNHAFALVLGSLISFPIGLIIGGFLGEYGAKSRRFRDEKSVIAPILAGDPTFSSIKIEMFSLDGTALLYGEVATREDLNRLQSRLENSFGRSRIKELMYGVSAREK